MIELTTQQIQSLGDSRAALPRLVNPQTGETFVLLRLADYQRLTNEAYDDSPWTRPELEALAWEVSQHEDWAEYDDSREEP